MQKQVIIISGKKYAGGLFWQPVAVGQTPRHYISSISKTSNQKFNLFVTYRNMVGLGNRRAGHRQRMAVAATEISDAFTEYSSYLACFAVAGGFWVIAARNGIIIADGLYDTETDAKNAYFPLSSFPDWGIFIAPSDWKFPRAVEKQLEDLISGESENTLKPTSNLPTYLLTALFLVLFLFGAFYLFKGPITKMLAPRPYVSHINPELIKEYQKKLEERKAEIDKQYQIQTAPEPKPVKMPYEELPDTHQRAEFCWKGIGYLMQPIPGWVPLDADCDTDTVSVHLHRNYGTLADLYAVVPKFIKGSEITEMSESDVMIRVYLPILDTHSSIEDMDSANVMREVNSIFQLIGADAEVTNGTEEISNAHEYKFINFVKISAKSKLTPIEFIKTFDTLSGVSIPKISWDSRQKTWNYEVKIYVK